MKGIVPCFFGHGEQLFVTCALKGPQHAFDVSDIARWPAVVNAAPVREIVTPHGRSDADIVQRFAIRSKSTEEDCVRPPVISCGGIAHFGILCICRAEIPVSRLMVQRVFHREACFFQKLLVIKHQSSAQSAIHPVGFLLPRPPVARREPGIRTVLFSRPIGT